MAPYAKTGGLADVMGALPAQLARQGHDVNVVMPFYDRIDTSKATFQAIAEFAVPLGTHRYNVKLFRSGSSPAVFFVHCPELYHRTSLYTSDGDEHRRFLALCYTALFCCQRFDWSPDIIHAHDWQAAMLPMLLKTLFAKDPRFKRTRTLLTIHNLMYQGSFPVAAGPDTNLDNYTKLFHQERLDAGRINFLVQGVLYADGVSTVSPTYAKEIQGPKLGGGIDDLLRKRSSTVVGILNGVDYNEW